jgi:glycosyltransferase involved in cell wall biosynthesis
MRKKYPDQAVYYVPNGVHTARFKDADAAPFRKAFGFAPEDRIALCLSRIDYQKNQLLLVEAFTEFARAHPDWKLVLIGPVTVEAYHERILEQIRAAGLEERVMIIQGLKPDDPLLPSAYKAADLFVLPTSHEPFGIVILEAWAAGTPVIATRIGGIPGFSTHEKNILHFEDGDRVGLRAAMERLTREPETVQRLTESAARDVMPYDWSQIAEQVLEIYREAIRSRTRKSTRGD